MKSCRRENSVDAKTVVDFWMLAGEERWFTKDAAFDGQLSVRFGEALKLARLGVFDHWAETPQGALGLIILLDQVSRNIHRGSPLAFAGDAKALSLAKMAVSRGYHQKLVAPLAMLSAALRRIPYVVTFHPGGHSSEARNRLRGAQQRLLWPLLARAARLLDMSVPEVKNRATITGAIEIGRHPGVVQVTFRAPLAKLQALGLGHFVRDQYGIG